MAFTSRWVCQADEDFNFDAVKEKLASYYNEEKGINHTLKSMSHLEPSIEFENGHKYINGIIYYQEEINVTIVDITPEKTLIEKSELRLMTRWARFSLSSNPGLILFNNGKESSNNAKRILSKIIFNNENLISNLKFDISKIEGDVIAGTLGGMWTFCFRDRNGNIQSGTVFGTEVNNDPIYGQVAGAPRNFIGIRFNTSMGDYKVTVYRNGTITILKNLDQPGDIKEIFDVMEFFKSYSMA